MTNFYVKPIDGDGYVIDDIEDLVEWCADVGENSDNYTVYKEIPDFDYMIEQYKKEGELENAQLQPNWSV